MILVAGATGFLGGEICRRLVGQEYPVRAMVRSTSAAARIEHLETLGVELVEADLKDRASLDAACRGVSTAISTATAVSTRQPDDTIEAVDRDGQVALVDAAHAAGVRHFIFVSYPALDDDDPCPLTVAKRAVERRLIASGMTYTILRPTFFMDVWLGPALGFDLAGGKVTVYGSGRSKVSWIALGDVAQFAVEAVDNPAARNAVVDLGGPQALSYAEVIALAERLGGRTIEAQYVPEAALEAQCAAATDSLDKSFAALTRAVARGSVIDMRDTLARFPVKLATVEDHVRRLVGRLAHA